MSVILIQCPSVSFFFNDTATTEIYTLSLHDALPISGIKAFTAAVLGGIGNIRGAVLGAVLLGLVENMSTVCLDRKSTRLNSSHANYLVCRLLLEKKKTPNKTLPLTKAYMASAVLGPR